MKCLNTDYVPAKWQDKKENDLWFNIDHSPTYDGHPEYCPFCGSELPDGDHEYPPGW